MLQVLKVRNILFVDNLVHKAQGAFHQQSEWLRA